MWMRDLVDDPIMDGDEPLGLCVSAGEEIECEVLFSGCVVCCRSSSAGASGCAGFISQEQ